MFLTAVLIVTVTGTAAALGVTGFGEIAQLAPAGNPWQAKFIGCENAFVAVTCSVYVAVWPADTVALGVVVVTEKSGTVEVLPERLATMLCGACPETLSTMDNCPVLFPAALGVKLTETVHWLLGAKVAPQVFPEIAKSPELAPAKEMLVMFNCSDAASDGDRLGLARGSQRLRRKH